MSVVFFTDRDLGTSFARVLADAGLNVEKHDDHFAPTTSDEEWPAAIGQRQWFAITKNYRIRYQPNELDAVMRAGVGLFVVIGKNVRQKDLAENFVTVIDQVQRFLKSHIPPFIAKIYRPGSGQRQKGSGPQRQVQLWLSYTDWLRRFNS